MITSDTMRKHLREGKLNASGRCEASRRWAAEETQSRKVKAYAWDLERQLSDLRAHADALAGALEAAEQHLDYCGYGDGWERECAYAEKLPEKIEAALTAYCNREE